MESVGKDEIEKKWSGALVGRVSEVGTSDKIPTKVPTISVCSAGLTSLGTLERLGPWAPAKQGSLVDLREIVQSPIFLKSESGSDQNATWCTGKVHTGAKLVDAKMSNR